jgi:hypothetical protein
VFVPRSDSVHLRVAEKTHYEDRSASLTPLEPPSESAHHAECSSTDPTPVDTDPEIPFIGPNLEGQGLDSQPGTVQGPLFYSGRFGNIVSAPFHLSLDDASDHASSETPTISPSPADPSVLSHSEYG